ncbi:hypothetical protein B9T54_17045 [Leptospira borgpetersenii serovar Hardjo-bovis]|nr:hypothetical protein B9T54_17045 [Leptospira borgpetersenii serovar Hardjo-bovis]TQE51296.1 hypothetical protein FFZ95_14800 [Leptospira borgpetersenii]TQE53692.1 hypothetical protein FFZ96_14735 [Leptospira borgpetersenii]
MRPLGSNAAEFPLHPKKLNAELSYGSLCRVEPVSRRIVGITTRSKLVIVGDRERYTSNSGNEIFKRPTECSLLLALDGFWDKFC